MLTLKMLCFLISKLKEHTRLAPNLSFFLIRNGEIRMKLSCHIAVSPCKPTAIITASLLLFVSLSANMSNGSQFGEIHRL